MAKVVGKPTIERFADTLDPENTNWVGAEISFHVMPDPGEEWAKDLTAGCLLDGVPADVPSAVASLREWDKDPKNSFFCYAPVGYLRDGVRMTLQVLPRNTGGEPKSNVVWQGDFVVRREGEKYHVEEMAP